VDATLLPSLIQAAPQYAMAAILLVLLTRVMGHATTDRGDYRADLDAAEQRHTAEITRLRESYEVQLAALRAAYDAEMASLRGALHDVRDQLSSVTAQVDAERRARWHAEDAAAEARRLAAGTAAVLASATTTDTTAGG